MEALRFWASKQDAAMDPAGGLGSTASGRTAVHCKDLRSRSFALERHSAQRLGAHAICQRALRVFVDEDAAPNYLRMRLEARRQVDCVADAGIGGPLLRAGVAGHDFAGGDADADADRWFL